MMALSRWLLKRSEIRSRIIRGSIGNNDDLPDVGIVQVEQVVNLFASSASALWTAMIILTGGSIGARVQCRGRMRDSAQMITGYPAYV